MTISFIKLSTGEKVLANVLHEDVESIHVHKPMSIAEGLSGQGYKTVMLVRYSDYIDVDNVSFDKKHVVMVADASDNVIKFYNMSISYYEEMIKPKVDQEFINASDQITQALTKTFDTQVEQTSINVKQKILH